MRYVSTRGQAPALGFSDVLIAGLARDGGLYVPETWPAFTPAEIAAFAGKPYEDVAFAVLSRFVGDDIAPAALMDMIRDAYAGFRHRATTPVSQLAPGHFMLELFHGPTLAFKDVAMQLVARLMDHVLAERGQRATVVAATSGDTGAAAAEAFRDRAAIDMFVLFPHGRVSDVQRRQMTTVAAGNVHTIAVDGTFDDAQGIVKALFNHHAFRDRVGLSGVNSINWARIAAQTVYYFVAAAALGGPFRLLSFSVPTGNFGDVLAGYVAMRMGLPIERLVVATNVNDILWRTLETGVYEVRGVVPTASPSMDIQVSSNFERLLFEVLDRDADRVRALMGSLAQTGSFTLDAKALHRIRDVFDAGRTDEAETERTIGEVYRRSDKVIDPHTAVAVSAAERLMGTGTPMVTLSTAHPAKFPDVVSRATGHHPPLPDFLADLFDRPERVTRLPADVAEVERFILARTRADTEKA